MVLVPEYIHDKIARSAPNSSSRHTALTHWVLIPILRIRAPKRLNTDLTRPQHVVWPITAQVVDE